MKILYFDCFAGISGDMTLGALIGAGADPDELRKSLDKLGVGGFKLEVGSRNTGHIQATDVTVHMTHEEHHHHHRGLSEILQIIDGSSLGDWVKTTASAIFKKLAEAEAKVHGSTPDKVHFHEVGAVDAIVDIVGTAICLDMLGRPKVISSPMPTFHGTASGSHGVFPLPAPATMELLKGVPWKTRDVEGELVTPTGAAIIAATASGFGTMPSMKIENIGLGAGKKEFGFPNVLRAILGEEIEHKHTSERAAIIETNIDDMNPQLYEPVIDRLFKEGALDVFMMPIQMKKNRPGVLLKTISPPEKSTFLAEIILRETTAIGVRIYEAERMCLERRWEEVQTDYGTVKVKIATLNGEIINSAPEYEDCRSAAESYKVPVKVVYDAATAAFAQRNANDGEKKRLGRGGEI